MRLKRKKKIETIYVKQVEHETTDVIYPFTGNTVTIDNNMIDLMRLMWDAGIQTSYCCEGQELDASEENTWKWHSSALAYILLPLNHRSFRFIEKLNVQFILSDLYGKHRIIIAFDQLENGHPRYVLRFPKHMIPEIEEWMRLTVNRGDWDYPDGD